MTGEEVYIMQRQLGVSPKQLGAILGLSTATVYRWISDRDKSVPSMHPLHTALLIRLQKSLSWRKLKSQRLAWGCQLVDARLEGVLASLAVLFADKPVRLVWHRESRESAADDCGETDESAALSAAVEPLTPARGLMNIPRATPKRPKSLLPSDRLLLKTLMNAGSVMTWEEWRKVGHRDSSSRLFRKELVRPLCDDPSTGVELLAAGRDALGVRGLGVRGGST